MEDGGLRASLRAMWASAAPSWGEHADYVDTRGAAVAEAMLDERALSPGSAFWNSPAARVASASLRQR
jgi:hypothetical protein